MDSRTRGSFRFSYLDRITQAASSRNYPILILHTGSSARRGSNTTGSGQPLFGSGSSPSFVLDQGEPFIHFIQRHQFLFSSSPMRPWHSSQINRLAVFIVTQGTVTLIISEAVLDSNNDPKICEDYAKPKGNEE